MDGYTWEGIVVVESKEEHVKDELGGFMSCRGCEAHTFILKQLAEKYREKKESLC